MIGLLFLLLMAVWVFVAFLLALFACRLFGRHWLRWPVALLMWAGLLLLPVLDEVLGGREFTALCAANSTIEVRRDKAVGRHVYEAHAEFTKVEGTRLTVHARRSDFIDVDTGERVVGFQRLTAQGGWLSEGLRFSETRVPLTFDGHCNPGGRGRLEALFKELRIKPVRRPAGVGEP